MPYMQTVCRVCGAYRSRLPVPKGSIVRLCSKFDLVPRAWPFCTRDERALVSLKMGTLFFMLEPSEARAFAKEIVAAADSAEAGEYDRHSPPVEHRRPQDTDEPGRPTTTSEVFVDRPGYRQ
jgi:hypothetical protein